MTKSIFTCECCNYSTRNKYDWNKHTQTKKHIRNSNIKIAIESFYNGTKYGVLANIKDEIAENYSSAWPNCT